MGTSHFPWTCMAVAVAETATALITATHFFCGRLPGRCRMAGESCQLILSQGVHNKFSCIYKFRGNVLKFDCLHLSICRFVLFLNAAITLTEAFWRQIQ